jgi:mercuric ion transport protein
VRSSLWTGASAIVAAAVFSACCWIPLLAIALGFSAGGAAVALERFRWPFLAAALAFLALGLYLNERRAAACGPDGTCPEPRPGLRRFNRVVLAIAAVFVLIQAAFPNYVGRISALASSGSRQIGSTDSVVTIGVVGMTCSGCEASVESALRSVPGVESVDVDFDRELATLHLTRHPRLTQAALAAALSSAGYQLAAAPGASSGANFAGHWTGRLPVSADKTVPLTVDLGHLGERWIGEADVKDQGVQDHPVGVAVEDSVLRLTLSRGVTFQGRLSPDGKSIRGQFTHGDDVSQLILIREGGAQFSKALLEFEQSGTAASVIRLSTDGEELRRDFNRERSKVRLMLLLSPT